MTRTLTSCGHVHVVSVPRRGCTERFLRSHAGAGESPAALIGQLTAVAARNDTALVALDVFGADARVDAGAAATTMLQMPLRAETGGGAQAWGVAGVAVEPIELDGRVVGKAFTDGTTRYVRLGGLLPGNTSAGPASQARQVFKRMDAALRGCGMRFAHVVRTWFFNRDILDWYGEFNEARSEFLAGQGIDPAQLPASTGVGMTPPGGAALAGAALAVCGMTDDVRVRAVTSPQQGPAMAYGSSFSRAVEIVAPDHRRLLVSGTASIGPDGRSLHGDDPCSQMARTFQVVDEVLHSRGFHWCDVVRGAAYFARAADMATLAGFLAAREGAELPITTTVATICRPELLFELEVDALVSRE